MKGTYLLLDSLAELASVDRVNYAKITRQTERIEGFRFYYITRHLSLSSWK